MSKTSRPDGRGAAVRALHLKAFPLEIKSAEADGSIVAYASTFGNVDLDGDIVEPGAFAKTIQESGGTVPMLWQHDPWEPIGVTTSLEEDEHGLLMGASLNLDTQRGREAHSLLKQGAMRGLSIGYSTVKHAWQGPVRRLQELKLREISAVTFPANPEARLVDAKAAADAIAELTDELRSGRPLTKSNRALLAAAVDALSALRDAVEPGTEPGDADGAATDAKASTPDEPAAEATRLGDVVRDALKGVSLHTESRKD